MFWQPFVPHAIQPSIMLFYKFTGKNDDFVNNNPLKSPTVVGSKEPKKAEKY